jgi:sarcosine oxidase gamma subunit
MTDDLPSCQIDRLPAQPVLEFVAFASASSASGLLPVGPGAARFDASRRPVLLHFAPERWLAPNPDLDTRASLARAAGEGLGVLIDVSGKWDEVRIHGQGAGRLLACDLAIEEVLKDRDCAAVTLFDCPATVARAPDGFVVWVQSSYTSDFMACAERCRELLESRA